MTLVESCRILAVQVHLQFLLFAHCCLLVPFRFPRLLSCRFGALVRDLLAAKDFGTVHSATIDERICKHIGPIRQPSLLTAALAVRALLVVGLPGYV